MASGINWKYRISNANLAEPPISYSVGIAWASGASSELTLGLVSGLDSIRTAYAELPGLGYHRNIWLKATMSGAERIADSAARYMLDLAARKVGKRTPLVHGGFNIEDRSVEAWFSDNAFVCGPEIATHACVSPNDRFLDVWEKLAIAADEYPRNRWGIAPKVRTLKVEAYADAMGYREVGKDETARVLDAAEAWGRAVDTRTDAIRADVGLVDLLSTEVVKAAVAVTTKRGTVSGLRHALRVAGYIQ